MSDTTPTSNAGRTALTLNGERIVTIVFDGDVVFDATYNWESGVAYANEGHRVLAIDDDNGVAMGTIQDRLDHELAAHQDCFGSDPLPVITFPVTFGTQPHHQIWACCVSRFGSICQHRSVPA